MSSARLVVLGLACLSALGACREVDRAPPTMEGDTDAATPGDADVAQASTCFGCLCADPAWSCAVTTEVTARGQALRLAPEVGFLELPLAVQYGSDPARSHPGMLRPRVWYSFHPATEDPERKPLLLLFNGGPYSATLLAGLGTGPVLTYGEQPAPNPDAWTRFANLLYVDPPSAGFSYTLRDDWYAQPDVLDGELDADLFLRALLAFLARHEALRGSRIGLVGESYGGVRATLMLDDLFHYETSARVTEELHADLRAHFAALLGGDGRDVPAEVIARQFAYQVLIQGVVGRFQQPAPCEHAGRSPYDCTLSSDVLGGQLDRVGRAPADPRAWPSLFGHDLADVAWMGPEARRGLSCVHPEDGEDALMVARLGELEGDACYYDQVVLGNSRGWQNDRALVAAFVAHTRLVRTLTTVAEHDAVVRSADLPAWISWARVPGVLSVERDVTPRAGVARPGWVRITFKGEDGSEVTEEFRAPSYDAGHMVSVRAGRELADDVEALLAE